MHIKQGDEFIPRGGAAVPSHTKPNKMGTQEPIAIIGMACRLPGNSNSPSTLWDFISNGGVASNEPPVTRFNLKGHYDGSGRPGTMRSPGGMFLENVDIRDFDAQFFSISKVDAMSMDPQHRQLLEVVYEGLENAGITLEMLKGKSYSCIVSNTSSDFTGIQARDPEDLIPNWAVGLGHAMMSNQISHFLDIKGPSVAIDTACSGSFSAIDIACRYLETRETEGAIVAGVNIYIGPEHNQDYSAMREAASRTGRCHTFDAKADGYIKAEGVNTVILKRLDDAIRDKDPIRAIIRGSSANSNGWTTSIVSPSAEAQAAVIRQAYARAGIADLENTSYIECHGTGTPAGDPVELSAIGSVFSESRLSSQPLIVGSIKSNIGHSEPAAGLPGVLKTVLALEKGLIPGNPTFITPNPNIDFEGLKVRASRTTIAWPKVPFRRASINAFGYGGSNTHLILEEPRAVISDYQPNHVSAYAPSRASYLFEDDEIVYGRPKVLVLSGNDESSMKACCHGLLKYLINPSVKINLTDLAYTLSERRSRHFNCGYVVADSSNFQMDSFKFGKIGSKDPRIGFVFTGQGAQWPKMGESLLEMFPAAKALIDKLDAVLKSLPDGPTWSLLDELTLNRSAEHIQRPEFSQPLVTALQLAILTVFDEWEINAGAVVGHSSGEIAAAVAAGLVTPEDAIKIAYYRGKAACDLQNQSQEHLGMLAVGLGSAEIQKYLTTTVGTVQVGCVNSPNSVTLSGKTSELNNIKTALLADGHFARMLQVDLAYHSPFMGDIAKYYKKLLTENWKYQKGKHKANMFSSVTGNELAGECDASYWESNMVSTVQFEQAVQEMLKSKDGPNFLIEIGPSGTLAGPISQIKKALGAEFASVDYIGALKRGVHCEETIFDVAGQLYLVGGSVNLAKVNEEEGEEPKVVVDLPNYSWNHSTKHWHESESSRDWRLRVMTNHDLLGAKILGTSWHSPSWRKILRVNEITWIRDHTIDNRVVFPAAGYIAMAMEALYQKVFSLGLVPENTDVAGLSYRLRNINFLNAMILGEKRKNMIYFFLTPVPGSKDAWHEFKAWSLGEGNWTEHCRGLICLGENCVEIASKNAMAPFRHGSSASLWYKALREVGYSWGPSFQKMKEIECAYGSRTGRVRLSLTEPESSYPQARYPIHPVCIDSGFQSVFPSALRGQRTLMDAIYLPKFIDEFLFYAHVGQLEEGIVITRSEPIRFADPNETLGHASAYDSASGQLLYRMSGLHCIKFPAQVERHMTDPYAQISWKEDITFIESDQGPFESEIIIEDEDSADTLLKQTNELVDLVVHKKPDLQVGEVSRMSDSESSWLNPGKIDMASRAACRRYLYATDSSRGYVEVQEKYGKRSNTEYHIFDITNLGSEFLQVANGLDLLILKLPLLNPEELKRSLRNAQKMVQDGGYLILIHSSFIATPSDSEEEIISKNILDHPSLRDSLASNNFQVLKRLGNRSVSGDTMSTVYLCAKREPSKLTSTINNNSVAVISFSEPDDIAQKVTASLSNLGWNISIHSFDKLEKIKEKYVLVLDDILTPVLRDITEEKWTALQRLLSSSFHMLWVTSGATMDVSSPWNSLFIGLSRTVRAEDPSIMLKVLDIENEEDPSTVWAIDKVLKKLQELIVSKGNENEYCLRGNKIYINRVLQDQVLNQTEWEFSVGAKPETKLFHANDQFVRLQSERPGSLESLQYSEIHLDDEISVAEVEVEIRATGVNYKDISVSMGNLGWEAAGVIRRVGDAVGKYAVGDRVVVYASNCFANRVRCHVDLIYAIPDSLSFEEAATLLVDYAIAIHGLVDIASTRKGQRVLIHSAANSGGIAAIHLCRYLGAEVFVTAGTEAKRKFLHEYMEIPKTHILSSASTDFGPQLMEATSHQGVDVVLNSLTGDLLEESWRCMAYRGVFLDISAKRDMFDREQIAVEPFQRDAVYRTIDIINADPQSSLVMSKLISRIFALVEEGHITPITPTKRFSFAEVASAFRLVRTETHVGKIVFSDSPKSDIELPMRPVKRSFRLRGDASYLIVGGLKGVCGSLALYLATQGAKHIVVMARSGYHDFQSQATLHNLKSMGVQVDLQVGDVSVANDVDKVLQGADPPLAGMIHGAMVLRDKTFAHMSAADFHGAAAPKVQGAWNLHRSACRLKLDLDFFTLLSSVSGVCGAKGQANYAAANVFLDQLANYRRRLGLPACSVDLGVVEDVGYLSDRQALADRLADQKVNEPLLHKILRLSILQQTDTINPLSAGQMIAGLGVPLRPDSALLYDARFTGICFGEIQDSIDGHDSAAQAIQAFHSLRQTNAERAALLAVAVELLGRQLVISLGLTEDIEPTKPLSV